MAILFTTSAPRSAHVHVEGKVCGYTVCGRKITDEWAGMMSECAAGRVTCIKCARYGAEWEDARRNEAGPAKFTPGQRVGILTGVQSVSGPWVGSYGTVIATHVLWDGIMEYAVRADGEVEAFIYRAYLLSDDVSGDIRGNRIAGGVCVDCDDTGRWDDGALCDCEAGKRQACMERHPAGKRIVPNLDAFPGGWVVRRAHYVTPMMRVIMATRELSYRGDDYPREYVIASHYIGATEWSNGSYTFDMARADRLFVSRVGSY